MYNRGYLFGAVGVSEGVTVVSYIDIGNAIGGLGGAWIIARLAILLMDMVSKAFGGFFS